MDYCLKDAEEDHVQSNTKACFLDNNRTEYVTGLNRLRIVPSRGIYVM